MHQLFLELRPFFTFKRCFPSDTFFKKRLICVLDSYFIHRFIIIKYGQVRFRVKSADYYKSYGPFSTSFFAKCLRVGEDGPGWGHLYHTDTFLVFYRSR